MAVANERYKGIVPWSKVGISNDLMFMLVMSNPNHCRKLIDILLGIKVTKFKRITNQKSILNDIRSKGIRLDICAETEDCIYDIEMQTVASGREELGKRVRYYQSQIDRKCLRKGQHYRKMRKSVIVFVCTFDPFGKDMYKYTFSNFCHEDKSIELKDDALKIFFYAKGNMSGATSGQRNFLEYVSENKVQDDFTDEINKAVEQYRSDGEKEETYMSLEQMLMDKEDDGRKEGRKEGRVEVLYSMVKDKILTVAEAAKRANMTVAEFNEIATSL